MEGGERDHGGVLRTLTLVVLEVGLAHVCAILKLEIPPGLNIRCVQPTAERLQGTPTELPRGVVGRVAGYHLGEG